MVMMKMEKEIRTAGHPSPQGVEKYGGIKRVKVIMSIKRDILIDLAERYGIPISMHIEKLIVEDANGKRTYSDIYWVQGGWGYIEGTWREYRHTHIDANDVKIADETIKNIISQYKPRKPNPPKIPVEIQVDKIEFDWEMLKNSEERLWKFEVHISVKYHWENGDKTIKLFIKFPNGEIDAHPLVKVYWGDWIVNTVAEFLKANDLFDPQTYLKGGVLDK